MLAGHCDHIGFMVVKIDATGFLLVEPVDDIDAAARLMAAFVAAPTPDTDLRPFRPRQARPAHRANG